jgi:hypothetical protein
MADGQGKKQIPFGDDNQKDEDKDSGNGNGNDKIQGFFAALRMTGVGVGVD